MKVTVRYQIRMVKRNKAEWITHDPGNRPLVIVGAGFPLAVLGSSLPSTGNFLEVTAKQHSNDFPIIKYLIDGPLHAHEHLTPNRSLNYVWTNIKHLALVLLPRYPEILQAYSNCHSDPRITRLIQRLLNFQQPLSFIETMLGIELKRAIALQYRNAAVSSQQGLPSNSNICDLLSKEFQQMTWISLNYDIVLESVLNGAPTKWDYCFTDWISAPSKSQETPKHILVKPHGSVNVWFKTEWSGQQTHSLEFENPQNLLLTCPYDKIGCDKKGEIYKEYRPWLIGYLPDYMKDEINSPGAFADCAHDLCKANMAYAALSLYRATSVYILGYSMPLEDQWIWTAS